MVLFLDVVVAFFSKSVVFISKALVRLFRTRGSAAWCTTTAKVATSTSAPGGYWCPTAEVVYVYEIGGSIYSGLNEKPFIRANSADEYAKRFTPGSTLVVRLKPGEPEKSIVRDADSGPK